MTLEVIEFTRKTASNGLKNHIGLAEMGVAAADIRFSTALKNWRRHRKLSQLDLALSADVSQRHISWLETGRSQPSREMVVRLADAMEIPLRERNALLLTAGFAAMYRESELEDPAMKPVLNALTHVLSHHDPYPAFVVDRLWNIQMTNQAADRLFGLVGDMNLLWEAVGDDGHRNMALLTLHPAGLRNMILNWDEVAPPFLRRIEREAMSSGDTEVRERAAALIRLAGISPHSTIDTTLLPVLPMQFGLGELKVSFFSVISTFGTPQDLTTDELRIEAMYPADAETEQFFRNAEF